MAKVAYLELVEMLSDRVVGNDKRRLEHIVARKKALKEEDADLDAVLDGILREIQGIQNES